MNHQPRASESGSSIILVLTIMTVIMVAVAVCLSYSTNINQHVKRSNTLGNATAIGNGCTEYIFAYWRSTCRAQPNIPPSSNTLASIPTPSPGTFGPSPYPSPFAITRNAFANNVNTMIQQYQVIAVDPELNPMPSASPPTPSIGQDSTNTKIYNYLATAFVTLPTQKGDTANTGAVVAKVQRIFQKQQISPWNYAIFYNDPLEIHPGPTFHVGGWVHTNSDLYTGHNTLWLDDKTTYGNTWTIGFMPGDSSHSGETPQSPNYPSNLPPALDSQHEPFGIDPASQFSIADNNATPPNLDNDSYHELIEPAVNTNAADGHDPFSPPGQPRERYYDQAGVIIQVNDSPAANTVTIWKPDGNGGQTQLTSSSTGNDLKLFNMVNGAIAPNYSFQDNRESAQVRVATLDLSALVDTSSGNWKANVGNPPQPPFNGIIYISDLTATEVQPGGTPPPTMNHRGIRIKNGSFIPVGGVTVASRNPVYLQGDFNTGSNPPSNNTSSPDATQPTGTTLYPQGATSAGGSYTRQPCSIVADAVYVLSNAWQDSWGVSGVGLGTRTASNTTINTAVISGIVPTNAYGNNRYSGGAENFPRFNEDWSNSKILTYYGSMVELFNSIQAIGNWGNGNVYNPPVRQWFFDTNFKTSAPPGTLMIYNYIKGRWALVQ